VINQVYQLVSPKTFSIKYENISLGSEVLIKPEYLAICHADQRYFLGQRDAQVMAQKLPMALIHEACGRVLHDPSGRFKPGQKVVMIPNIPGEDAPEIYENYARGSGFLSSGHDGFMREVVSLPADRIVPYENVPERIAAVTEFVSVACHAVHRFDKAAHSTRNRIGIWGDGSLAYTVANVLRAQFPDSEIIVVGLDRSKMSHFTFVTKTYHASALPADLQIDHAFECCGGEGCYHAFENIIAHIRPQGTVTMMGVSENRVPINTRMVLERGLTLVGCSRSGRSDFEAAVKFMEQPEFNKRMDTIITEDAPVSCISDISRAFATDLTTPFKTVFKWNL